MRQIANPSTLQSFVRNRQIAIAAPRHLPHLPLDGWSTRVEDRRIKVPLQSNSSAGRDSSLPWRDTPIQSDRRITARRQCSELRRMIRALGKDGHRRTRNRESCQLSLHKNRQESEVGKDEAGKVCRRQCIGIGIEDLK